MFKRKVRKLDDFLKNCLEVFKEIKENLYKRTNQNTSQLRKLEADYKTVIEGQTATKLRKRIKALEEKQESLESGLNTIWSLPMFQQYRGK